MTMPAGVVGCRHAIRTTRALPFLRGLLCLYTLAALCMTPACSDEVQLSPAADSSRAELIVAGRKVTVELALDTPTRTQGLMYRTALGDDQGMLFIFPDVAARVFWMRNTLIPLDIVFLDDMGTVINVEEAPPAVERPGFHSLRPARFVLELRKGWSQEYGLLPGQTIAISQALRDRAEP